MPIHDTSSDDEHHFLEFGTISGIVRGTSNKLTVAGASAPNSSGISGDTAGISIQRVRVMSATRGTDVVTGVFLLPRYVSTGNIEFGDATRSPDGQGYELPYSITGLPLDTPVIVSVSSPNVDFFAAQGWSGQVTLTSQQSSLAEADFAAGTLH